MNIGIQLPKNKRANLLEIKEQLLKDLDDTNINYSIPFDKTNKENVKETIIQIPDLDIEISIENDIIKYIKSGNNMYSSLTKIPNIQDAPTEHIKNIKQHVVDKFGKDKEFSIEKIDTKTMNIAIIITDKEQGLKARAQIIRNRFGDVFINTLSVL